MTGDEPLTGRFVDVPPAGALFEQVVRLADANRATFGLVPQAWLADYAAGGRLLAVVRDGGPDRPDQDASGALAGFAAYRLPKHEVAIGYLGVDPRVRGGGVARALVHELSKRYTERRGIRLWCRRDFAAHHVWPRLGFVPLADRPGRGRDGKPLTLWWRGHGHLDLLSWTGSTGPSVPVVVDANVFIDLFGKQGGRTSELVRSAYARVQDRVDLIVTDELFAELDRNTDADERARLREIARGLPHLSVHADDAERMVERLNSRLAADRTRKQDISDVRHVAHAAASGIEVLVTGDGKLRESVGPAAADIAGLVLVAPEDLVTLVDQLENTSSYSPTGLLGTGFTVVEVGLGDDASTALFLDKPLGERRKDFNERLRTLAGLRPDAHRLLVLDPNRQPLALLGYAPVDGVLEVSLSRMLRRPGSIMSTLAAHVINRLRPAAQRAAVSAIRLSDPHADVRIRTAALDDGFRVTPDGTMVAITVNATCARSTVSDQIAAVASRLTDDERSALRDLFDAADYAASDGVPFAVSAIEHMARPMRLLDGDLATWLVPIQPYYATQLFDFGRDLFGQRDDLGLSIEHVYYRANSSGEQAPARILWYVSERKVVIGCSALIEVVDDTPEAVWRRFKRLGIYDRRDVYKSVIKRTGRVRALRVIDTEIFVRPVTLDTLRELGARNCQTINPQWPTRLDRATFADLMKVVRTWQLLPPHERRVSWSCRCTRSTCRTCFAASRRSNCAERDRWSSPDSLSPSTQPFPQPQSS